MLTIDWLPTASGPALPAHPLVDALDVAMAADLAHAIASAGTAQHGGAAFAIKNVEGVTLHLSTRDGIDAPIVSSDGAASSPATFPVRCLAEVAPAPASCPATPDIKQALRPASQPAGASHRPTVAELRAMKTSGHEWANEDGGTPFAAVAAPSTAALAGIMETGRKAGVTCRDTLAAAAATAKMVGVRAMLVAEAAPPDGCATIEASVVARHLGVSQLVAAAPPEQRRGFGNHLDYLVLGVTAALLLFFGSPIYSIYATMSQVRAAEGGVIGKDIDIGHLRGSLDENTAPSRLAEGRSVARDPHPVRLVGIETSAPGDVVTQTLGSLAHGTVFAKVLTSERIDIRKLFWHLRFVSTDEIDVRLYDWGERAPRSTMVFQRTGLLSWKLFDLRTDRDV